LHTAFSFGLQGRINFAPDVSGEFFTELKVIKLKVKKDGAPTTREIFQKSTSPGKIAKKQTAASLSKRSPQIMEENLCFPQTVATARSHLSAK